ncbi:hypothetical protein D1872_328600 [compost metagenome]
MKKEVSVTPQEGFIGPSLAPDTATPYAGNPVPSDPLQLRREARTSGSSAPVLVDSRYRGRIA